MRIGRWALLGAVGSSAMLRGRAAVGRGPGPEAAAHPVGVFAERPAMEGLKLSPDGTKVLARLQVRGQEMLGTYVISTGALKGFALPKDSDLRWYRWAGNDRFLVSVATKFDQLETINSLSTLSIKGMASRLLSFDLAAEAGRFIGFTDLTNVGDDVLFVDPSGEYLLLSVSRSYEQPPGVYRCSLKDNHPALVVRPIDGVHDWYADNQGTVRAGIGYTPKGGWFFSYRRGPDTEFHTTAKGEWHMFEGIPTGALSFVAGTDDGYILSNAETGLSAAYKFNFATRTMGEKIFACPTNDVESLEFDEAGHALQAIHYTDDRPRTMWIDPLLKEVQDGIDRALAGRQNSIVSWSDDKSVLLVHSGSTRDPGTYYVFHLANTKLSPLVRPNEKLLPAQLSPMEAVRYKARDGLEIPACLTLPTGREPKGLPLVIMPHGGPYGVRDTLEFNPEVQFLANRGYAVLQPNYRGSDSYGIDYYKRGYGEWGRRMQDDLDDGMDWLVGRGIVDPKRACLVGGSYGGYAAAWARLATPNAIAAPSASPACSTCASSSPIRATSSRAGSTRNISRRCAGPRRSTSIRSRPWSPSRGLRVPLLLIHGDADSTVPIDQSKDYDTALTKAGKPHEFYVIKDEGHGFYRQKDSFAFYLAKVDAFLARHNPGDQA